MKTQRLKYGNRALDRGNTTFFDRSHLQQEVADVLPRLPSDMSMLVLSRETVRGGIIKMECSRRVVEAALAWLCANNPGFEGVAIEMDNLPAGGDGAHIDLPVQGDSGSESAEEGDEDLGPSGRAHPNLPTVSGVLPDPSRRLTNQEKEKQHDACADALLGEFRLPLVEPLHEWRWSRRFGLQLLQGTHLREGPCRHVQRLIRRQVGCRNEEDRRRSPQSTDSK